MGGGGDGALGGLLRESDEGKKGEKKKRKKKAKKRRSRLGKARRKKIGRKERNSQRIDRENRKKESCRGEILL